MDEDLERSKRVFGGTNALQGEILTRTESNCFFPGPEATRCAARLLQVEDLGLVPYGRALEIQRARVAARLRGDAPDTLLLLEHPAVFTLGRDGHAQNLLVPHQALGSLGIEYVATDRGGDITYHGPGQLVGYPILDLREHRQDLRWYVERVEQCLIDALRTFGIEGARVEGMHGVWVGDRKIAALGIHVGRWITSHGFALNVDADLRPFDYIVPCGIAGRGVTSMAHTLGAPVAMAEAKARVAEAFARVFDLERV